MRLQLLGIPRSFSFETVMSFPDKIELLKAARQSINIERVKYRVQTGGHPVPEEKNISRYAKSLDLLLEAIKASDRAY